MIDLESNFFGRVANKLFASCFYYYENAFQESNAYPLRLLLSAIFLFLGKVFFYCFVLERKLISFLEKGGLFLVTSTIIFCCYFLSKKLLGI